MNQVNLALSEVRQAARDIENEISQHQREITTLEARLNVMVKLRTTMEEAIDELSSFDSVTGAITIDADLDDTQEV